MAIEAFSESGQVETQSSAKPTNADGLHGICAAPGLSIGRVVRFNRRDMELPELGDSVDRELTKLADALKTARGELDTATREASAHGKFAERDIFIAHLALVDDPELISTTERKILDGAAAGFAFRQGIRRQCSILSGTGNALLAERANDLLDLELRVLRAMGFQPAAGPSLLADSILIADDLTPTQLTGLAQDWLRGIATAKGGATSHVAILARAMGIPALVAVGPALLALADGQQIILNADTATIDLEPNEAALAVARAQITHFERQRSEVARFAAKPAVTLDGVTIEVAANVANQVDVEEALRNGADGIGLLRTELLFMDRANLPGEAEQQAMYTSVLRSFTGKPVIIRTLDIGGDKEAAYLQLPPEANPALGLRGVRIAQIRPDVLDAQLAALLASQHSGQLRLLLPMVADLSDVRALRDRLRKLADRVGAIELPQLGLMIEVPSAAVLAEQLATEADFLSIGTNDLTQYTLAMDRTHPDLSVRLDPLHPAVLRLIAMTVAGATKHGKWVGVCGGVASDIDAVPVLIGLGVSELSVSPRIAPTIKARVRELSVDDCRTRLPEILRQESAFAVRELTHRFWPNKHAR
jgi:phosphocarrier protein FPr/phosphocarrier protein